MRTTSNTNLIPNLQVEVLQVVCVLIGGDYKYLSEILQLIVTLQRTEHRVLSCTHEVLVQYQ